MSTSSVELLEGTPTSWRKESAVYLTERRSSLVDRNNTSWPLALSSLLISFGALLTVFLLLLIRAPLPPPVDPFRIRVFEDNKRIDLLGRKLQQGISGGRILDSIKWLAKDVHVAGTNENEKLLDELGKMYSSWGYSVRFFDYSVLLSYPNYTRPNTIEVLDDESGHWLTVSEGFGRPKGPKELKNQESDARSGVWWSAYSANGTVEGSIVYANYGRSADFDMLKNMKIDVRGKIILMRFGGVSRSVKIAEAESRGAIGVVLFSDPQLSGPPSGNNSFPSDMSLPGDDVQRGGLLRAVGDPETPSLPSLSFVPRQSTKKLRRTGALPKIPATPVGSDVAARLMRLLDGTLSKEHRWQGGLSADYRLSGSRRFRLSVHSHLTRRPIRNMIATMKGDVEPDRWVMVGNHVDAWVKGAIDPATGTAAQLEVARVIADSANLSPPRRSIVFCHWDAEEFGLIGSSEWIEEMGKILDARAVAMINVDHVAGNASLQVKAVPLLYRVLSEAAQRVEQNDEVERENGRLTLLDSWKYHGGRSPIEGDRNLPHIGLPGGASDHQRFISLAGVPSVDIKMTAKGRSSYPLYHSMHEVPWTVEKFISSDGAALATVARFVTEATIRLANHVVRRVIICDYPSQCNITQVIPFSAADYAQTLSQWLTLLHAKLDHLEVPKYLSNYELRFRALITASSKFREAAEALDERVKAITSLSKGVSVPMLNAINDRLMRLERVFLDGGAFSSPLHKHLVFSPSKIATARTPFALIWETAHDWSTAEHSDKESLLETLSESIARLTLAMQTAAELLVLPQEE
uniref:Peptidase n=1 Tax=Pristionchus pacificus TaxID=54126 RepID=A0A454XLV3_PRIPA|eukprot:PDM60816.1 Peptidase [Pristionchus pacificus]